MNGRELRELLTLAANTVAPAPDGLDRIRARITAHNPRRPLPSISTAAPGRTPGRPATTSDGWKEPMDVSTIPKHPMQLDVGDVIAVHPTTGEPGEWTVTNPPVRFGDIAEIEVRSRSGGRTRFTVFQRETVTVDPAHRERRLHAMSHGEEHAALRWLHDHEPGAFDRAADYVDRIRALGEGGVRKEGRS